MKNLKMICTIIALSGSLVFTSYASDKTKNSTGRLEDFLSQLASTYDSATNKYPDFYGGSCVDEEDKLTIFVTEDVDISTLPLAGDPMVEFEVVDHSYNELLEFMDQISDKAMDDSEYPFEVYGMGIAVELNKVIIDMSDISEENINFFKENISDSELIFFQKGSPWSSDLETVSVEGDAQARSKSNFNLGDAINVQTPSEYRTCSIGFRCKLGDEVGFVTTNHGQYSVGATVTEGGNTLNPIGKVKLTQYSDKVDASFVTVEKAFSVTQNIGSTGRTLVSNHWVTDISEGSTLYLCGQHSSSSGTISNNSYKVKLDDGEEIFDCYRFKAACEKGDSGGLVYALVNGDYVPAGIIAAKNGFGESAAIKITNIVDAFGVTPY